MKQLGLDIILLIILIPGFITAAVILVKNFLMYRKWKKLNNNYHE